MKIKFPISNSHVHLLVHLHVNCKGSYAEHLLRGPTALQMPQMFVSGRYLPGDFYLSVLGEVLLLLPRSQDPLLREALLALFLAAFP